MIRVASFFSGIGGFELGIKQAAEEMNKNVKFVFASEIDKHARTVYINHFGEEYLHGDITKIKAADVPEHDILCGGFPCQDVSIAGKRKGLGGERSGLFFELVRILRKRKPRIVFLENVKGLLSSNDGWDFARVLIELEKLGYCCEWQVLNTKNYLPQNRERVFIVGHLATSGGSGRKIFPIGQNGESVNELQGQSTNTLTARYEGAQAVGTYIIEGQQYEKIKTHSLYPRSSETGEGGTGHLMKCDGTSYCLDCGNMQTIELHKQYRRLTPMECERLQGFPDGWTKCISDTQRYKCLGNAVSVPVIQDVARHLFKN